MGDYAISCLVCFILFVGTLTAQLFGDIYSESRSLYLERGQQQQQLLERRHICLREVPAIFFQTFEDETVRGNGSTTFYHRIEICCEGYIRSKYNTDECVPDCSITSPDNCQNGFCRAPQQCNCFEEFVKNEHGACIQTCPISCQHGRCYLNGSCNCNAGYTLDPDTRKFCRAQCGQGCGMNQDCVAPNKCACKSGYRMTAELGCQPICTPDCGFGKCVGPNECECFAGYMKRPQRNVCEAECYINCGNGFCESLYKCQCHAGYKYDSNTTSCLPDCADECQHGVCIAPGVCKCFEGYEPQGNSCVPICRNDCGYYGHCLEPNICGCLPTQQHCISGYCDALGHCICRPGLTHFIDKCVDPLMLPEMVANYEQREHYNKQLQFEFSGLIGRYFNLTN